MAKEQAPKERGQARPGWGSNPRHFALRDLPEVVKGERSSRLSYQGFSILAFGDLLALINMADTPSVVPPV